MNLETNSTVANAVYSSNEMIKTANSTQAKAYSNNNTSFATEMKNSSEQNALNETVDKSVETETTEKTDKKEETKKTETKTSEKVVKEQTTQTLEGEVTAENQTQNNQQGQGQNNQQNGYTPLTDQIQAYMNANGVDINFTNLNPMSATSQSQLSGMVTTVNYSGIQMSDTDAKFFADLVSKTDMTAGSIAAEFEKAMQQGNVKMVQSTAKASMALIEALKESAKNHQAFRIDFDKDISVILQVDKGGKINANFIPGDKAVENYLRNNIETLRQRFTDENIAYGDLTYSQSRRQKNNRERNNKENGHE
ncbi:hypothetical protein IKP85_02790 [bacterium]|nr:hypothetical protein [bacterium]